MARKHRLKYDPFGIIIDQTILCNQRCSFCHRSLEHSERYREPGMPSVLPFGLYSSIIDQAAHVESLRWLSLCGPMGDPLLVSDLVERLDYARRKRHFETILINSNGQALDIHDPERLLKSCTDLQFSVDSIQEETYAKIHCGGNLTKVLDNIRTLSTIKRKLSGQTAAIRIRFTENDHNVGEWEEFRTYFSTMADDIFRVKVHSFMGRLGKYQTRMGALLCNQPFNLVNFNCRGEITTCCINWKLSPTFGSIKDYSLRELWESHAIETWRDNRIGSTCEECGGLGTFQQRVDCTPNKEEVVMAEQIALNGERNYYERAFKSRTQRVLQPAQFLTWLRKLFS